MSFHTKTLVDGHRMFRCIPGIFLFKLFEFFKIHLKCIFIIDAFAPMSQNTMSVSIHIYHDGSVQSFVDRSIPSKRLPPLKKNQSIRHSILCRPLSLLPILINLGRCINSNFRNTVN
jgi:hypothetical protein